MKILRSQKFVFLPNASDAFNCCQSTDIYLTERCWASTRFMNSGKFTFNQLTSLFFFFFSTASLSVSFPALRFPVFLMFPLNCSFSSSISLLYLVFLFATQSFFFFFFHFWIVFIANQLAHHLLAVHLVASFTIYQHNMTKVDRCKR